MPPVVKNLVIINALFFLATIVMQNQGINLIAELGLYYVDSPFFKPYQLATHFFMHGSLMHIFFNMFALIVFGSHLERMWGPKRFLLFYFITAMGAAILHLTVQGYEIYQLTGTPFPGLELGDYGSTNEVKAFANMMIPTVGASGAVYGLIAAFAMLFPNTELMLLFPPIPIKAKWLAIALAAIAVYQGYVDNPGDSVAHFAHLGGMLFGFIIVKIWQRDKNSFY
ncbi:MAG: rhomboid family intramembrane serine protease [Crocinitomicaceae bacterium]|nr:rhomboid family intramembrane serine protease [Crocinitomicaceae bacterium]